MMHAQRNPFRGLLYLLTGSLVVGVLPAAASAAEPQLRVVAEDPSGVVAVGEPIVWNVAVEGGDAAPPQGTLSYRIKRNGGTVIQEDTISGGDLGGSPGAVPGAVTVTLDEPATVYARFEWTPEGGGAKQVVAVGAVADPSGIEPVVAAPDDFDAFWKAALDELRAVPANPRLAEGDSGKAGVTYATLQLANIQDRTIHGHLAHPAAQGKYPALLILPWAGVYPIGKGKAVNHAAQGWLTLELSIHDLPLGESKAFYDDAAKSKLGGNYTKLGHTDPSQSYFRAMYLACYRGADFLAEHPRWDGRTLVVMGTSQGGGLSIVTAGLHPEVSAVIANVPAGCDTNAGRHGRAFGWPYWQGQAEGESLDAVLQTSRYFDVVNFAPGVECPALVSVGLIDTSVPASGVFNMCNQLGGEREVIVLATADHKGTGGTHQPFHERSKAWLAALRAGNPAPVEATAYDAASVAQPGR